MIPSFWLGETSVSSYALLALIGWSVGALVFILESRRRRWPMDNMLLIMVGGTLSALLGAAVMSLVFIIPEAPWDLSHLPDRRSLLGGIAGGMLGVELTKWLIGYRRSTGAAFALAVPLGSAIGRIGCWLGGCCFGTPSQLPWAVEYPAGSPAHSIQIQRALIDAGSLQSTAVHPTPMYELAVQLALLGLLWARRGRADAERSLWPTYLCLYAIARFALEFVRGDSLAWPLGVKPVQFVLLATATYYAARLQLGRRPQLATEA